MPTNEEYESLKAQKREVQRKYNDALDRIEECDYKIARLKRTKAILTEQKCAFAVIKKDDESIIDQKKRSEWSGNRYSDFCAVGNDMVDVNEMFYSKSLDHALDAVNDEITRLQNLKLNEHGLLGRLASKINSLANRIENFFN